MDKLSLIVLRNCAHPYNNRGAQPKLLHFDAPLDIVLCTNVLYLSAQFGYENFGQNGVGVSFLSIRKSAFCIVGANPSGDGGGGAICDSGIGAASPLSFDS